MEAVEYGDYTIRWIPKPIPTRAFDYDFAHKDYDGAPDSGDTRCGSAISVEAAKDEILEIESGLSEHERFTLHSLDNHDRFSPGEIVTLLEIVEWSSSNNGRLKYTTDGMLEEACNDREFYYKVV
jgi:hypothetical protein